MPRALLPSTPHHAQRLDRHRVRHPRLQQVTPRQRPQRAQRRGCCGKYRGTFVCQNARHLQPFCPLCPQCPLPLRPVPRPHQVRHAEPQPDLRRDLLSLCGQLVAAANELAAAFLAQKSKGDFRSGKFPCMGNSPPSLSNAWNADFGGPPSWRLDGHAPADKREP